MVLSLSHDAKSYAVWDRNELQGKQVAVVVITTAHNALYQYRVFTQSKPTFIRYIRRYYPMDYQQWTNTRIMGKQPTYVPCSCNVVSFCAMQYSAVQFVTEGDELFSYVQYECSNLPYLMKNLYQGFHSVYYTLLLAHGIIRSSLGKTNFDVNEGLLIKCFVLLRSWYCNTSNTIVQNDVICYAIL